MTSIVSSGPTFIYFNPKMANVMRRLQAMNLVLPQLQHKVTFSRILPLAAQAKFAVHHSSKDVPRTSSSSPLASSFHTCSCNNSYRNTEFEESTQKSIGKVKLQAPKWLKYNDIVYPPTEPGQPKRPAEICHSRFQIKYGTKKMWYLACMVRGMSIDEAIKQLSFHKRKGAAHVKEVLEEAQNLAVKEHNVEFKSNLWICDSFATKGIVVRGVRSHGRGRFGLVNYRYSNYFVRLREGRPPKDYYPADKTGYEKMEEYIKDQRSRKIKLGL